MTDTGRPKLKRLSSPEILKEIGNHLRWLREAYEQVQPGQNTQQQWATRLGVLATTLSRWESGTQHPPLDQLTKIDLSTGCGLDYVFYGVVSRDLPSAVRDTLLRLHGAALNDPIQWRSRLRQLRTEAPGLAQSRRQIGTKT